MMLAVLVAGLVEWAGLFTTGYTDAATPVIGVVACCVMTWAYATATARWTLRAKIVGRYSVIRLLSTTQLLLNLTAYAVILTDFHWAAMLNAVGLLNVPVLGPLLVLLPAVLLAAAAMDASYHVARVMSGGKWTRASFFEWQLRWLAAPLVLFALAMGLRSGINTVAETTALADTLERLPTLRQAVDLLPVVVMVIVAPFILRLMLRVRSLPAGPLRDRLVATAKRMKQGFRDLLVLHTGPAKVPNAMVVGVSNSTRYVLLTDGLLALLNEDEIEAVLCHELGHARHHHYLLFVMVVVAVGLLIDCLIGPALIEVGLLGGWDAHAMDASVAVVALTISLGVLMLMLTVVSRVNERQADLNASRFARDPLAIASSLERLAYVMGHGARSDPEPTHGSIGSRIDFIHAVNRYPVIGQEFERRARAVHGVLWVVVGVGLLSPLVPLTSELGELAPYAELLAAWPPSADEAYFAGGFAAVAELTRMVSELDRLQDQYPASATLAWWRGTVAEKLAAYAANPSEKLRWLRHARQSYQQVVARLGFRASARLNAMAALERTDARLAEAGGP